jgi:SAM-dependent methyltransferase
MGERTEAIGGTPTGGATSASAASADAASTHATSARSFDAAADVYEASRPDYPSAAVDWMVPAGARRALDVGAGTGKLTRALVDRGLEVTAADPSAPMLEVLRRVVPKARAIVAGAEHLPLDDASVDVVTVAQAWHWVDPLAASAEAARVLRPRRDHRSGLEHPRRDSGLAAAVRRDRRLGTVVPRPRAGAGRRSGIRASRAGGLPVVAHDDPGRRPGPRPFAQLVPDGRRGIEGHDDA